MKSKEKFIIDSMKIHGQKYDYNRVIYKNNSTKIIIVCEIHGEFLQTPRSHLQGRGCPECGKIKKIGSSRKSYSKNKKKFFDYVEKLHNNFYTYDKNSYTDSSSLINIQCTMHGDFQQLARVHKRGSGCPSCARTGFNPNKKAFLYLLITDSNFIGFGITGKLEQRLYRHKLNLKTYRIEIISVTVFHGDGRDVFKHEKYIKEKFSNTKVMIEGFKTEAFSVDLLPSVLKYLEESDGIQKL